MTISAADTLRRRGHAAADERARGRSRSATELALIPNTVLCASDGVSSPIMLAVAGMTTPLNRPFNATPATTTATQGAMAISETATATITAATAVVRT